MFKLIYTIGVGYDSVVFVWGYAALRDIEHSLPSINNFPLLHHAGDIGIAWVYHFTGFLVIFGFTDTGFRHNIGIALICTPNLLLVKTGHLHNLIQRLNLIIFRLITLISLILINCFISLNTIFTLFILTI